MVTPGDTLRPEIERDVLAWIAKRRASDRADGRDLMEFVQARDLQREPRRFRDCRQLAASFFTALIITTTALNFTFAAAPSCSCCC